MAIKLRYQSSFDDIGWSLRETLDEIKRYGETKQLKFNMLLKYGRLLLMEGKLDDSYKVFQQCSVHAIDNEIPDTKELYYWASRCLEEQGNMEKALSGYLRLLENERVIQNDEEIVNVILDRLILFGNITTLVNEYKKKREEELNNPKDLLGKIAKFLRESDKTSCN
jgi:tetratricopeptide (TPR) repeat protein